MDQLPSVYAALYQEGVGLHQLDRPCCGLLIPQVKTGLPVDLSEEFQDRPDSTEGGGAVGVHNLRDKPDHVQD